uniref:Helicase ARIP4 n=2 Tax=Bursaphelenchus xylophilus TaxID=6326 RepID=A0A1I7S3T7_BURXY
MEQISYQEVRNLEEVVKFDPDGSGDSHEDMVNPPGNEEKISKNNEKGELDDNKDKEADEVEKEDGPLQINIATSKGITRKRLHMKSSDVTAFSEAAQDAQKKERERLERLEKQKVGGPSTMSYQPVVQEEDQLEEEDSDDCVIDCIVAKKKKEVEVVDLSSDEEEFQRNGSMQAKMYRVRQEEEARTRRVRRKSGTLDKLEFTAEGRLLVNEGKPAGDPDVFVAAHLTHILQPHQLGGVRFMYDNVIESLRNFDPNNGFGCILAHSMGLGKTLQVITFVDIFFRLTKRRKALIICPVNVLQNWYNEFDKWLPMDEGKRDFNVFLVGDAVKTLEQRTNVISQWDSQGGVILVGYEMFKLLTQYKKKPTDSISQYDAMIQEKMVEICDRALVDPGPDLVVCDEGHRIKNLKTACAAALTRIKTKRRIVLTGYPLQNNLMEYYCMVDFVRPSYLGEKKTFAQMFDRPIKNGMCIDSTPMEIKIARQKTHVLIKQLKGFVQRRTQHILKKILPESREYVVVLRKSEVQKELYKKFLLFVKSQIDVKDTCFYNPLKAYAICSKIWNHPDLLFKAWKAQLETVEANLQRLNNMNPFSAEPSTSNGYDNFGNRTNNFVDATDANRKGKRKKKTANPFDEDDNSIPFYWADGVMVSYQPNILTNSYKMLVALTIIEATVIRGEKILLFSGSLLTLSLLEEFLRLRGNVPTTKGDIVWKKNDTYFRFDGSTSASDREKLIDRFNNDPSVHLFLISTRAGSLGVNLVSATRVIIFDASWNPCHDAQAVCRIYRYGQKKKTFIYRLVMNNCMERAIFARQISKSGLQQRVVDEQHIDAKVTTKELENLIAYDETLDYDNDHPDLDSWKEKIDDDLLRDIATFDSKIFAECPFLHESLMLEREEGLSQEELIEAELLYEKEKVQMNQGSYKLKDMPSLPSRMPQMFPPQPFYPSSQPPPYMGQSPITIGHVLNNMNYNPNGNAFNNMQRWNEMNQPIYPMSRPAPLPRDIVISANPEANGQFMGYNNQFSQPFNGYSNGIQQGQYYSANNGDYNGDGSYQTPPTNLFTANENRAKESNGRHAESPNRRSQETHGEMEAAMAGSSLNKNLVAGIKRAFVQGDIELSSVSKPGTKLHLKKGDPILVVFTKTGGVYIRTSTGQIADAANTIYAKAEVIELE